ncbi:hypothetical protein WOLCODRAFT_159111 [Wolfiporia cocos MD-104 SS10]|uniref:Fungal-type protein kinase domain-containing protein n=1 Tax=Wolfiporia cocos (strain MD-104) TaxID=742152 RepID=A0A2H3JP68_WOLCO|nr:hypothetical protein WOLCODRAFT_159111 [Wolfiporia cocos MD-104 SS10]
MEQADIYQMGICHLMEFDTSKGKFAIYRNAKLVLGVNQEVKDSRGEDITEPLELEVTAADENDVFTDFGIVGRGTTVIPVQATGHSVNVCGSGKLVVKIAWPVKRQNRDETECIRKIHNALAKKKKSVLKHIIELKCYMSHKIDELELPRAKYDRLEAMNNVSEFRIIFIEAVRAHHWVYETTNILHQAISSNNVMFYHDRSHVHGILCDWDQAAAPVEDLEESEDQGDDPAMRDAEAKEPAANPDSLDWKAILLSEESSPPDEDDKVSPDPETLNGHPSTLTPSS